MRFDPQMRNRFENINFNYTIQPNPRPLTCAKCLIGFVQRIPLPICNPNDSSSSERCEKWTNVSQSSKTTLQLATSPDNPMARTLPERIVNNLPSIPFWFGAILFLFGGVVFLAGCGQGSSPMIIIGVLTCIIALLLTVSDRRPEDVRIQAVIMAELEFGDIERQVFFADLVKRPDHAAFDQ